MPAIYRKPEGPVSYVRYVVFAAGGLVLPTGLVDYPEDLDKYFQEDGRWPLRSSTHSN